MKHIKSVCIAVILAAFAGPLHAQQSPHLRLDVKLGAVQSWDAYLHLLDFGITINNPAPAVAEFNGLGFRELQQAYLIIGYREGDTDAGRFALNRAAQIDAKVKAAAQAAAQNAKTQQQKALRMMEQMGTPLN